MFTVEYFEKSPNNLLFNKLPQHKDFYDFFNEKIVDEYLDSVNEGFDSNGKECKVHGYSELRSFLQTEETELENIRV